MRRQPDEIHRRLRSEILSEVLKPAEVLVERALSITYGVSRTPVREALRLLVKEGLVTMDPGQRYAVRQMTIDDIVTLFVGRESVEGMIARLAAIAADDCQRAQLDGIRNELNSCDPAQDTAIAVKIGRRLHDSLATIADNPFLLGFYHQLRDLTALARNIARRTIKIEVESRNAHRRIIRAVINGEPQLAEGEMRSHLQTTCSLILESKVKTRGAQIGELAMPVRPGGSDDANKQGQ